MKQNNKRKSFQRSGLGNGGACVCPSCGAKVQHVNGTPCMNLVCKVCGTTLQREELNNKSMENRVTDNKSESYKKVAVIDSLLCIGCGRCVNVCTHNAIHMEQGKAIIDETKCIGCMKCAYVCKAGAINIKI